MVSRPRGSSASEGVACDPSPPSATPCPAFYSAIQSDPSLPSARFSTLLRQTGSAGARLRHRNPTQLEERGGGRETIPGMTRHLFSCQDKFLALKRCAMVGSEEEDGGSSNKKGFSLGPTLLLGTDEADSDISLRPITIHH